MESEESPIFTSEHAGIFLSSAALVGATENTHLRLVLIRDLDPQYGPGSSSEPVAHFLLSSRSSDDNTGPAQKPSKPNAGKLLVFFPFSYRPIRLNLHRFTFGPCPSVHSTHQLNEDSARLNEIAVMHFLKTNALLEVVLFFGRDRSPSPICMVPCCRVYTTTRTIFGCPPPSWLKWACRPWSARHRPAQRTSASKKMRSRRSGRDRCPSLIS